jgi:hypothetical protein
MRFLEFDVTHGHLFSYIRSIYNCRRVTSASKSDRRHLDNEVTDACQLSLFPPHNLSLQSCGAWALLVRHLTLWTENVTMQKMLTLLSLSLSHIYIYAMFNQPVGVGLGFSPVRTEAMNARYTRPFNNRES